MGQLARQLRVAMLMMMAMMALLMALIAGASYFKVNCNCSCGHVDPPTPHPPASYVLEFWLPVIAYAMAAVLQLLSCWR